MTAPVPLEQFIHADPAELARACWRELMWCTNAPQLLDVAARIRKVRSHLSLEDVTRLRSLYEMRLEQLGPPREAGKSAPGDSHVMASITVAYSMDDFTFARYLRAIQDANTSHELTAIARELAALPASQERDTLQRTVRRMLIRRAVEN